MCQVLGLKLKSTLIPLSLKLLYIKENLCFVREPNVELSYLTMNNKQQPGNGEEKKIIIWNMKRTIWKKMTQF